MTTLLCILVFVHFHTHVDVHVKYSVLHDHVDLHDDAHVHVPVHFDFNCSIHSDSRVSSSSYSCLMAFSNFSRSESIGKSKGYGQSCPVPDTLFWLSCSDTPILSSCDCPILVSISYLYINDTGIVTVCYTGYAVLLVNNI